jgi:hypothetical protein
MRQDDTSKHDKACLLQRLCDAEQIENTPTHDALLVRPCQYHDSNTLVSQLEDPLWNAAVVNSKHVRELC